MLIGIETVRRDNCPLVARLMNDCLQKILIDRDPMGAMEFAKQNISDFVEPVTSRHFLVKVFPHDGNLAHLVLDQSRISGNGAEDVHHPGLGVQPVVQAVVCIVEFLELIQKTNHS